MSYQFKPAGGSHSNILSAYIAANLYEPRIWRSF